MFKLILEKAEEPDIKLPREIYSDRRIRVGKSYLFHVLEVFAYRWVFLIA